MSGWNPQRPLWEMRNGAATLRDVLQILTLLTRERFHDSVIPVISVHPRGLKTQIMDVYSSTPGTAELHLVNE